MPAVQRTFELIPTTLTRSNGARPPMTSKAAKKAYAKANAGPRVSRAEQRKRDAAELERLRKEDERERAAAKAKAAREKKAAKMLAEKEERRRKGIPEPSRFVRASQPTISLFVKGNVGAKRSWQQMEGVTDGFDARISKVDHERGCRLESAAKRMAAHEECEIEHTISIIEKTSNKEQDSEDEFGEFPSFSQTDILDRIDSSVCSLAPVLSPTVPLRSSIELDKDQEIHPRKAPPKPPETRTPPGGEDYGHDMVSTQLFTEAIEAVSMTESMEVFSTAKSRRMESNSNIISGPIAIPSKPSTKLSTTDNRSGKTNPTRPSISAKIFKEERPSAKSISPPQKTVLSERSLNMPPPNIPVRNIKPLMFSSPALKAHSPQDRSRSSLVSLPFTPQPRPLLGNRKSTPTVPPPQRQRFLPGDRQDSVPNLRPIPPANVPPSATQAFLENHLDDFYPSPTQEIRELLDDAEPLPSNTQIARDLSPVRLTQLPILNIDESNLVCTQDWMLSSQDLLEIDTPTSPIPNFSTKKVATQEVTQIPMPPPVLQKKRRFFEEKEEDIRETSHSATPKHTDEAQLVPSVATYEAFLGESPSFQAAIAESKELAEIRRLADASFDNFDDDVEPLEQAVREGEGLLSAERTTDVFREHIGSFEATTKESERFVEQKHSKANSISNPRRYFQEKEEDLVHAALYESKILGVQQMQKQNIIVEDKAPSRNDEEKEKRTFKRVYSGMTDYGDDIASEDLWVLFDA